MRKKANEMWRREGLGNCTAHCHSRGTNTQLIYKKPWCEVLVYAMEMPWLWLKKTIVSTRMQDWIPFKLYSHTRIDSCCYLIKPVNPVQIWRWGSTCIYIGRKQAGEGGNRDKCDKSYPWTFRDSCLQTENEELLASGVDTGISMGQQSCISACKACYYFSYCPISIYLSIYIMRG